MHYLAMGDTAAAFRTKRAALNYQERVETLTGICDDCGTTILHAKTPRGKRVRLDPVLSTSFPDRFALRDGLAEFCDGFDRAHDRAGYPLHKLTCPGKPTNPTDARWLKARKRFASATVELGPNRGFGKSDFEEVE